MCRSNTGLDADGRRQVRAAMAELVALEPDVIVTTDAPMLASGDRRPRPFPIVFAIGTDPVRDGLVASLDRPGGNVTGFTALSHPSCAGKRLETARARSSPAMTRIGGAGESDQPGRRRMPTIECTSATSRRPAGVEVARTPCEQSALKSMPRLRLAGPSSGSRLVPVAGPLVGNRGADCDAALHASPAVDLSIRAISDEREG